MQDGMIYHIERHPDVLAMRVLITDDWAEYLKANAGILMGWADYNLITYLQRRNPSVPGISSKIYPPQERKLNAAKEYWRAIIRASQAEKPLQDIYSGELLAERGISIDHFVPWSYVAHDELWNLIPTTRSVNSSKSNNLPAYESARNMGFGIWKYEL